MSKRDGSRFWSNELDLETRSSQRCLKFRQCFEDVRHVAIGAATAYASLFASPIATRSSVALLPNDETIDSRAAGQAIPISQINWSDCDLATCFDDLDVALDVAGRFSGRMVIGTAETSTLNLERFQKTVSEVAGDRSVHCFVQSDSFPYRIESGGPGSYFIAALGIDNIPEWPSIGLAMPTLDSPSEAREAVFSLLRSYPGPMRIAICANGSLAESIRSLQETSEYFPGMVEILRSPENLGYGQGANRALAWLKETGDDGLLGVTNDDVLADIDCVCELVSAFWGLEALGSNPGVVGPVSNRVHGRQCVDVGPFESFMELSHRVAEYRKSTASSVTQTRQLRGLFMLIKPQLIDAIGGFDPIFGIGNFEDDDHNLRTRLAGFTLWIADGAYLYHHGSTTFRRMNVDYEANIRRNADSMVSKWKLDRLEDWLEVEFEPGSFELMVPLDSWNRRNERVEVAINGESVDLVTQASDREFADWIVQTLSQQPRAARREIIESLRSAA